MVQKGCQIEPLSFLFVCFKFWQLLLHESFMQYA